MTGSLSVSVSCDYAHQSRDPIGIMDTQIWPNRSMQKSGHGGGSGGDDDDDDDDDDARGATINNT
jgi:hypothetical protein